MTSIQREGEDSRLGNAFDLMDIEDYLDFSLLPHYIHCCCENTLAIAASNHLILLVHEQSSLRTKKIVVEYKLESDVATSVAFLTPTVLAIGFDSGLLVVIDNEGNELRTFQGTDTAVKKVIVVKEDEEEDMLSVWLVSTEINHFNTMSNYQYLLPFTAGFCTLTEYLLHSLYTTFYMEIIRTSFALS